MTRFTTAPRSRTSREPLDATSALPGGALTRYIGFVGFGDGGPASAFATATVGVDGNGGFIRTVGKPCAASPDERNTPPSGAANPTASTNGQVTSVLWTAMLATVGSDGTSIHVSGNRYDGAVPCTAPRIQSRRPLATIRAGGTGEPPWFTAVNAVARRSSARTITTSVVVPTNTNG